MQKKVGEPLKSQSQLTDTQNPKRDSEKLKPSEFWFMLFCMLALLVLLPMDRYLHLFEPPIADIWYGALFAGAGGKYIKDYLLGRK